MFRCFYNLIFGAVEDEPEEETFELFSEPEHKCMHKGELRGKYTFIMHPTRHGDEGRLREDESLETLIDRLKTNVDLSLLLSQPIGIRITEDYYKSGGGYLVMAFRASDKATLYEKLATQKITAADVAYYYWSADKYDLAGITSTAEAVEKGIIFAGPAAAKPKPAAKTATAMLTAAGTLATPVKDAGDSKQSVTPPSDVEAACASAASAV